MRWLRELSMFVCALATCLHSWPLQLTQHSDQRAQHGVRACNMQSQSSVQTECEGSESAEAPKRSGLVPVLLTFGEMQLQRTTHSACVWLSFRSMYCL